MRALLTVLAAGCLLFGALAVGIYRILEGEAAPGPNGIGRVLASIAVPDFSR